MKEAFPRLGVISVLLILAGFVLLPQIGQAEEGRSGHCLPGGNRFDLFGSGFFRAGFLDMSEMHA